MQVIEGTRRWRAGSRADRGRLGIPVACVVVLAIQLTSSIWPAATVLRCASLAFNITAALLRGFNFNSRGWVEFNLNQGGCFSASPPLFAKGTQIRAFPNMRPPPKK
jgi:hypothetical protein